MEVLSSLFENGNNFTSFFNFQMISTVSFPNFPSSLPLIIWTERRETHNCQNTQSRERKRGSLELNCIFIRSNPLKRKWVPRTRWRTNLPLMATIPAATLLPTPAFFPKARKSWLIMVLASMKRRYYCISYLRFASFILCLLIEKLKKRDTKRKFGLEEIRLWFASSILCLLIEKLRKQGQMEIEILDKKKIKFRVTIRTNGARPNWGSFSIYVD